MAITGCGSGSGWTSTEKHRKVAKLTHIHTYHMHTYHMHTYTHTHIPHTHIPHAHIPHTHIPHAHMHTYHIHTYHMHTYTHTTCTHTILLEVVTHFGPLLVAVASLVFCEDGPPQVSLLLSDGVDAQSASELSPLCVCVCVCVCLQEHKIEKGQRPGVNITSIISSEKYYKRSNVFNAGDSDKEYLLTLSSFCSVKLSCLFFIIPWILGLHILKYRDMTWHEP